ARASPRPRDHPRPPRPARRGSGRAPRGWRVRWGAYGLPTLGKWSPTQSDPNGRAPHPDGREPGAPRRWRAGLAARSEPSRLVEVVPQHLGARRVAQLRHGLGLDLADPLAGDAVDLADLVEGLGLAVREAEPHGHHAGLALGEGVQHRVQLL